MRRIIKNSSLTDSQIGKREEEARRKAHPTLILQVRVNKKRVIMMYDFLNEIYDD